MEAYKATALKQDKGIRPAVFSILVRGMKEIYYQQISGSRLYPVLHRDRA
jgi:hypothetical protein